MTNWESKSKDSTVTSQKLRAATGRKRRKASCMLFIERIASGDSIAYTAYGGQTAGRWKRWRTFNGECSAGTPRFGD